MEDIWSMLSIRKKNYNQFSYVEDQPVLLFENGPRALLDPKQQMRVEFHTDLSVLQVKTTQ